jgi:hypothetical protein
LELLPAVLVVGQGRVSGVLVQGGLAGLHVPVDAHRRGQEVPRHPGPDGGRDRLGADEDVGAQDVRLGPGDELHAAHVRGQLVDVVEGPAGQGSVAIAGEGEVGDEELVSAVSRYRGSSTSTPRTQ